MGDLAVIVTHPESHFIANISFSKAYEKLLDWISQDANLWRAQATEVAQWWIKRYKGDASV